VIGLAAGVIGSRALDGTRGDTSGLVRFVVPALIGFPPSVAVSPDGRSLVWQALASESAETGTRTPLFARMLDSDDVRTVPDSDGAMFPFWAPDSRRVAYFRDGQLVISDLSGASQRLALPGGMAPVMTQFSQFRGTSWHAAGGVLIGFGGEIWNLDPAQASQPWRVVSQPGDTDATHAWPEWFPDGRRYLYLADPKDGTRELRVGSIDGQTAMTIPVPGEPTRVLLDPAGYLVYGRNGALIAHPFDVATAELRGSPINIAPDVDWSPQGWLAASVSSNGVLALRAVGVMKVQFEWVDRVGRRQAVGGAPEAYTNFDLSSDGQQVAVVRRTADMNNTSVALIDFGRDQVGQAVEPASIGYSDPTFSADGTQIAYRRGRQIVSQPANGGPVRVLADWLGYPDSWSADGRYLALGRPAGRHYELWALALDGSGDIPLVEGLLLADEPRFSPDGRWVLYHAVSAEAPQVFAIPFPPTGERWQISSNGGVQPRWRADGREFYFLAPDGSMMAVPLPDGRPSHAGKPVVLFNTGLTASAAFDQFAPAPDGQRFLIRRPVGGQAADTAPITVILNWHAFENTRAEP
jgi:Tol biopolymer transport system component